MPNEQNSKFFRPWFALDTDMQNKNLTQENSKKRLPNENQAGDEATSFRSNCEESNGTSSSENGPPEEVKFVQRERKPSASSVEEPAMRSCLPNIGEKEPNGSLNELTNFVTRSPISPGSNLYSSMPLYSALAALHPFYTSLFMENMPVEQRYQFSNAMYPNLMPIAVDPREIPSTSASVINQGCCVRPFAVRPYAPMYSMKSAVEFVSREDAAAKERKKLRPKKFKCEYCELAFSNNGQLKGHIRIHTGERPYVCDTEGCEKSFTRNEELTRHKRIHTGLRPHACNTCGKRFGRKDHLKKHTKIHENKDAFFMASAACNIFPLGSAAPTYAIGAPLSHPTIGQFSPIF